MTEKENPSGDAAEVDRRLATITSRFPDRFSPAQVDEIRKRVERSIALGNTLRNVHLPNSTGPGFDTRARSDE